LGVGIDIPLSMECRRVITGAAEEADRAGSRAIGTEHLLAAVLRLSGNPTARLLNDHGITIESVAKAGSLAGPGFNASSDAALGQFFKTFEALWNDRESYEIASLFADDGELVDVSGKLSKGNLEIGQATHAFDRLGMDFVSIRWKQQSNRIIDANHVIS